MDLPHRKVHLNHGETLLLGHPLGNFHLWGADPWGIAIPLVLFFVFCFVFPRASGC